MEPIKRRVLLEDLTSRVNDVTFGQITATTINFKIHLNQDIDDMGLFTDVPKILEPEFDISDFYKTGNILSGTTDSKIELVRSYDKFDPFIIDFDTNKETYTNFSGETIDGRTRVTSIDDISTGYTIDGNLDSNIGTSAQTSGILYEDLDRVIVVVNDDSNGTGQKLRTELVQETSMHFLAEGLNETNTSFSAITKQEYLFGITSNPEVESDVFIDRGVNTVFDLHLRLSEIKTLDDLVKYGNGLYNIDKQ